MNPKFNLLIFAFIISLATAFSSHAETVFDTVKVQMPVRGVYAPEVGFDDNDEIQVVVDGYLPNACYKKSKTQVSVKLDENKIYITQYANKIKSEQCNNEDQLPDSLKASSSFVVEAEVGQLPVGEYQLVYTTSLGVVEKKLTIEKAQSEQIDNAFYAITTNAFVNEVVSANSPTFLLNLTGYLNSPCVSIAEDMNIVQISDVIVVLPAVVKNGRVCNPIAKEFVIERTIKTPPPGRYLLHIRSHNGTAVNRLFTVK